MNKGRLEAMYETFKGLNIAVVGDFVLDKYLTVDTSLDEPSLETGRTAYQVVETRKYPGACGTITNNLWAFGIGNIYAVTFIGQDGIGYELKEELVKRNIRLDYVLETKDMITPSYVKPMMRVGNEETESNRLDIKNFKNTPMDLENSLLKMLDEVFNEMDAVIILDQMVENNCGVITDTLRKRLITLGAIHKDKIIFADSRSKIHLFENMAIKCNNYEICSGHCASRAGVPSMDRVLECAGMTYRKNKKPVFVTMGKDGILTVGKQGSFLVPTADVPRPYDICGAGDSVTAAAVSALASGWNEVEAAFFANIVASVTIRKIGVTGTASYEEVLETHEKYFKELKWQELH